MKFIEMTGDKLAEIINDGELHNTDLESAGVKESTIVRVNQHGDIEVYECARPNCTFMITNYQVQGDLSAVPFVFDCMLIADCENYCTNKGVCPAGPVCGDCLNLCESVRCP